MSLDIYLMANIPSKVYEANITHNLTEMAGAVGIYKQIWRPEEVNIKYARQLILPITNALILLRAKPDYYKTFNPPNSWGNYDNFIEFLVNLLEACEMYPSAKIDTWR